MSKEKGKHKGAWVIEPGKEPYRHTPKPKAEETLKVHEPLKIFGFPCRECKHGACDCHYVGNPEDPSDGVFYGSASCNKFDRRTPVKDEGEKVAKFRYPDCRELCEHYFQMGEDNDDCHCHEEGDTRSFTQCPSWKPKPTAPADEGEDIEAIKRHRDDLLRVLKCKDVPDYWPELREVANLLGLGSLKHGGMVVQAVADLQAALARKDSDLQLEVKAMNKACRELAESRKEYEKLRSGADDLVESYEKAADKREKRIEELEKALDKKVQGIVTGIHENLPDRILVRLNNELEAKVSELEAENETLRIEKVNR